MSSYSLAEILWPTIPHISEESRARFRAEGERDGRHRLERHLAEVAELERKTAERKAAEARELDQELNALIEAEDEREAIAGEEARPTPEIEELRKRRLAIQAEAVKASGVDLAIGRALEAKVLARAKRYPNLRPLERDRLRRFGRSLRGASTKLGKRLERVSECGCFTKELRCATDGPQSVALIPCGDRLLCPYCAERDAEELRLHIAAKWKGTEPEQNWFKCDVVALVVPLDAGNLGALRAARAFEVSRWRRVPRSKPRWVLADGSIVFLWPGVNGFDVPLEHKGAKKFSAAAAAELVSEAWLSVHRRLRALIEAGDFDALVRDPWLAKPVTRTGGGKYARGRLPWWGTTKAREQVKEDAKRVGKKLHDCPKCGGGLKTACKWLPSNATLFERSGVLPDWKFARMVSRSWVAKPFIVPGSG
jgi:hypothetical protein